MIALILGGAPEVFAEAAAAQALLGDRRPLVVACNSAIAHWPGRLDAAVSLHPDLLPSWMAERTGNADFRAFVPNAATGAHAEVAPERWPGSSGLYALQIALFEMGATVAILCGVPMQSEAGHIVVPGPWAATGSYRQAFIAALPEVGARVRSMSGWTRELFGAPTPEWLASTTFIKPLRPASAPKGSLPMHHVKNVSGQTQAFNIRLPNGGLKRQHLQPGEGGAFDCDPNQAVFVRGHLEAAEIAPPAATDPAATPKAVPAPRKRPAPQRHRRVRSVPG